MQNKPFKSDLFFTILRTLQSLRCVTPNPNKQYCQENFNTNKTTDSESVDKILFLCLLDFSQSFLLVPIAPSSFHTLTSRGQCGVPQLRLKLLSTQSNIDFIRQNNHHPTEHIWIDKLHVLKQQQQIKSDLYPRFPITRTGKHAAATIGPFHETLAPFADQNFIMGL